MCGEIEEKKVEDSQKTNVITVKHRLPNDPQSL